MLHPLAVSLLLLPPSDPSLPSAVVFFFTTSQRNTPGSGLGLSSYTYILTDPFSLRPDDTECGKWNAGNRAEERSPHWWGSEHSWGLMSESLHSIPHIHQFFFLSFCLLLQGWVLFLPTRGHESSVYAATMVWVLSIVSSTQTVKN